MEQHLTLSNVQLVLPPRAEGLEQDLVRHLWSMSEMAALNPSSQSFLIHLNLAKQCHHIAHQRRLHVSRWIAEQRAGHREDREWNRRFGSSLANEVLLLWSVFRMPCLELLDIGYAAASRPGGVKDIVSLSRQLVDNGDPLPCTPSSQLRHRCTSKFSPTYKIDPYLAATQCINYFNT